MFSKNKVIIVIFVLFLSFLLIQPIAANIRDTAQPPGKIFTLGEKSAQHSYSRTPPGWTSSFDTDTYRLKWAGATQNNGKSLIYREIKDTKNRFIGIDEQSWVDKDGISQNGIIRFSGSSSRIWYYECTIKLISNKKSIKLRFNPFNKKRPIKIVYYTKRYQYTVSQVQDFKYDSLWEASNSETGINTHFPEKGSEPGKISIIRSATRTIKSVKSHTIIDLKNIWLDLTGGPDLASYNKFVKTKKVLTDDQDYWKSLGRSDYI